MHVSEVVEDSTLDGFTQVAAWYLANPPSSWYVARHPLGWTVTAADGTFISSHRTKSDAAADLADGPCAKAHWATLNWYLGHSSDPDQRPLTGVERRAIARALSSIAVATLIRRFEQP
jgi:hypothetical protein